MTIEEEIHAALKENLTAAERALVAKEWVAVRALAEQEARLMDSLRVCWRVKKA